MQLAKDKIDRAIAGLDANWQGDGNHNKPERGSEGRQIGLEQGSEKGEGADANPPEVSYEESNLDRQPEAAKDIRRASDEEAGSESRVSQLSDAGAAGKMS